jgi:hypothetical protein
VTTWPATDVARSLASLPIVESPFLQHGMVIGTGRVLLIGTEPIDRAERIRRAARHEARLICRQRARELGHDCPDPVDSFGPHLPADELQVRYPTDGSHPPRWRWPDLEAELLARSADLAWDEERRRDREAEEALEDWQDRPYVAVDAPAWYPPLRPHQVLDCPYRVHLRPYPQHSTSWLRDGPKPSRVTYDDAGFAYVDYSDD